MDFVFLITVLQAVLAATWRMATPLIFAAIGEMFTERAGVLNIGLEGVMLGGALSGFVAVFFTGSLGAGLAGAILMGLLFGLLFALFTVTLKTDQIVTGVALNLMGLGLTGFFHRSLFGGSSQRAITFESIPIPVLSQIPFVGEIFFRHNLLVYAAFLLVPLASFVLYKTDFGLSIRAVGEHPRAADTAGIDVTRVRYASIIIGSVLASIGGAYLTIAQTNQFVEDMVSGRGFIALAVVVFGRWTPGGILGAALLFGVFFALQLRLQAMSALQIPYQALQVLPYLATIVALVAMRRHSAAPAALTVPYEK